MLDNFGIDNRFGSLNVGLRCFNLRLRCFNVGRCRIDLRLTFVTVALDFRQGLRASRTHAGLGFQHRRLQTGHFSGQA